MFLDDAPPTAQRAAFQQYMQNGGGVAGLPRQRVHQQPDRAGAGTTTRSSAPGSFQTNTWGPTRVTLQRRQPHPPVHRGACRRRSRPRSASGTPGATTCGRTRTSTSSPRSTRPASRSAPTPTSPGTAATTRWCGRNRQLQDAVRQLRPQRDELQHQHRAVVDLRQRAAEPVADRRAAVAGRRRHRPPTTPRAVRRPSRRPPGTRWSTGATASASTPGPPATANGTAIQQYACNGTTAQQYQFAADQRRVRAGQQPQQQRPGARRDRTVDRRLGADPALDLQRRQQPAVAGRVRGRRLLPLRQPASGKCLDVPGASTADSVQLVQYTCNGTAAQSFRLVPQS